MQVATYNILSSSLSNPGYFRACDAIYLDPVYRIEKLKEKLIPQLEHDVVICLQEISQEQESALQPLFASFDYNLSTSHYGGKLNC